jgi:hypothetical protein
MPEWKISSGVSSRRYMHFAVGGYQHPANRLWQIWVLFDWENVNWVAAYERQECIEEIRKKLLLHIAPGEQFNREKALNILDALYNEREADPLPVARHIEHHILRSAVWPPRYVRDLD